MSETNQQRADNEKDQQSLAADLIRQKINNIYGEEPSVKQEVEDVQNPRQYRSKYQQFMYDLIHSGRSLADIQTAWHNYYVDLPDEQKHEVWQEFYKLHGQASRYARHAPMAHQPTKSHQPSRALVGEVTHHAKTAARSVADIKHQLLKAVAKKPKLKAKHHLKSLVFGLAMGGGVVLVLLFGFFNERFIAPFISPSRNVSSTQIIIDPSATAVGPEPKIIIPKINVEVPVVYDQPSIDEKAIQGSLQYGVVHYADSPLPGEQGNVVIVGHSSNNILNHGKYKFAFVLLSRLAVGDTFMLNKNGKRYVYRVYDKRIVEPNDLSVLDKTDRTATTTLITCDPPGTSLHRLVVLGEQILPDPASNVASSVLPTAAKPKILPSNAPSLWQRLKDWLIG